MSNIRLWKSVAILGLGAVAALLHSVSAAPKAQAGDCVVCKNCSGSSCCSNATAGGRSCVTPTPTTCTTSGNCS